MSATENLLPPNNSSSNNENYEIGSGPTATSSRGASLNRPEPAGDLFGEKQHDLLLAPDNHEELVSTTSTGVPNKSSSASSGTSSDNQHLERGDRKVGGRQDHVKILIRSQNSVSPV